MHVPADQLFPISDLYVFMDEYITMRFSLCGKRSFHGVSCDGIPSSSTTPFHPDTLNQGMLNVKKKLGND